MMLYSKWAQKEHSTAVQITVILLAGVIILILLPYMIVVKGTAWDQQLGLAGFDFGPLNVLLGGLMLIAGLSFGFWSVLEELTCGRGTPLPIMPTQGLLIRGPFRYCRNPMTLGNPRRACFHTCLTSRPARLNFSPHKNCRPLDRQVSTH